jgi:hypothetical protein
VASSKNKGPQHPPFLYNFYRFFKSLVSIYKDFKLGDDGQGRVSNVRFARFNLLGTSPPCEEVSHLGAGDLL